MEEIEKVTWHKVHGDYVEAIPENADLYADSENCPVDCWGIKDRILGYQGHPECTTDFIIELYLGAVRELGFGTEEEIAIMYKHVVDAERIPDRSFMIRVMFNFVRGY